MGLKIEAEAGIVRELGPSPRTLPPRQEETPNPGTWCCLELGKR